MRPVELFRTGEWTDRFGRRFRFGEAEISQIGEYQPEVYRAPVQLGHEGKWVGGFLEQAARLGDFVVGWLGELAPEFADCVRGKQVSLRLWTPERTDNPRPGTWGINHVALVDKGAVDLLPVDFAADEGLPVFLLPDFGFEKDMVGLLAKFVRRLREFVISHSGAEVAERLFPETELEVLEAEAAYAKAEKMGAELVGMLPAYSAPPDPRDIRIAELEQEKRERQLTEQLNQRVFAPQDGKAKLPPRYRPGLVRLLRTLDGLAPVDFGGEKTQSPTEYVLDLLADLPGQVYRGPEIVTPENAPPPDFGVEPTPQEIADYYKAEIAKGRRNMTFTQAANELYKSKGVTR